MRRLVATIVLLTVGSPAPAAGPRFEISIDPRLATDRPGRLLVALAPKGRSPSFTSTDPFALPVLGVDATTFAEGTTVTLDGRTMMFPAGAFAKLPKGEYSAQAIYATNRDLSLFNAPGNLTSGLATFAFDPAAVTTVKIPLTKAIAEEIPKDTSTHRYVRMPSKLLSEFHGRPMVYRFAVVLPSNFAQETKRYPLVVQIGGFGSRYTSAARIRPDERFVQVLLDGAGPFGDPYQVNSANNGPYGDALVKEVIPAVEKAFRCLGTPKARFTTGGSTGGWASLALQIFHPDSFNGCWSQCPDGVDFRAFELIDIYKDANAYVNRYGFERPAKRTLDGDTVYTVRHECRLERVLGRGGRWELGGLDWGSWNAVYGPRGADGLPKPLWNGETGAIDKAVLAHWERYDLRKHVVANWPTLGPKLAGGKIRVWVGDADDYFLNNAVHRFKEASASLANPKFDGVIEIAMRNGHRNGWSMKRVLDEMAERAR